MTYCEKLCSVFGSKDPFPPPFLAFDANKKLYGNVCVCVCVCVCTWTHIHKPSHAAYQSSYEKMFPEDVIMCLHVMFQGLKSTRKGHWFKDRL